MKNCFKVFSLKLANALMKEGFDILDYEINVNNPKLKVFIFRGSKELRNKLTELTSN